MTTEHTDLSDLYPADLCAGYVDASDRAARPTLLWETTLPALLHARHMLFRLRGVDGHRGTGPVDRKWERGWKDLRTDAELLRGDAAVAKDIARSMAKIDCPDSEQRTWGMAPAGAYPIVPVALGGDPCSMRYRTTEASHAAPLRVFFPLLCSSKIKVQEFAGSLADVIAALRILADHRPVELIGYGGTGFAPKDTAMGSPTKGLHDGAIFTTFPIPMDYSDLRAAALFADASIGRSIVLAMHNAMGRTRIGAPWPWEANPLHEVSIRHTKMALGLQDDDVLIPPLFGRDGIDAVRMAMIDAAARSGITIRLAGTDASAESEHHLIPY